MPLIGIGDLGDPQKDAAALKPLVDGMVDGLVNGITNKVVPALQTALSQMNINISFSKKDNV